MGPAQTAVDAGPSSDEVRAYMREKWSAVVVSRASAGAVIILCGIGAFSAAKFWFEPHTGPAWYLPFLALAVLQAVVWVAINRPRLVEYAKVITICDVVATCAVIAWGGAVSERMYSAEFFLLGVATVTAALVPWGVSGQLVVAAAAMAAVAWNAYLVTGTVFTSLGFPTLIPLLVLFVASVYTAHVLQLTRLRAGREELGRIRAQAESRILNENLERRVAERTAELEVANEELEAFSYSVSHDLRAPLRGMDGLSAALLDDYGDRLDTQARDYLQRIRESAQRLGILIDDLLRLAHVMGVDMRRTDVDLSMMAAGMAARLSESRTERDVEFVIEKSMEVRADEPLVRLAMENLLDNAWKFTEHEPRGKVEVGTTEHNGRVAYFVRDNGVGFEMQYVHKLFGAFERLHGTEEFDGTGIGLATVQRIVQRHNGSVWAHGQPGEGATFYFTLPRQGSSN